MFFKEKFKMIDADISFLRKRIKQVECQHEDRSVYFREENNFYTGRGEFIKYCGACNKVLKTYNMELDYLKDRQKYMVKRIKENEDRIKEIMLDRSKTNDR